MVMHDALESEAAACVADCRGITGKHAAPFEARERPSRACWIDQSIHAAPCGGGSTHEHDPKWCTSMELEVVNVVATRAKYLASRHHQGLKASAVGERVRDVCDRS